MIPLQLVAGIPLSRALSSVHTVRARLLASSQCPTARLLRPIPLAKSPNVLPVCVFAQTELLASEPLLLLTPTARLLKPTHHSSALRHTLLQPAVREGFRESQSASFSASRLVFALVSHPLQDA